MEKVLSTMPDVQSFHYVGQARGDIDIDLSETLTPNGATFGFPVTDIAPVSANAICVDLNGWNELVFIQIDLTQ